MGLVDTAVVGRLGAAPLGAVGLANGLFFGLAVIGIGTMLGLDPLFAQALGARDEPRARDLIWQGLWLSGLVTLALALLIAALPLVLEPAGIAPAIARDARLFLWFRLIGLWPMLGFAALRSYLQAREQIAPLMAATVLANLANFGLDLVFVFGKLGMPALGAPGSGLVTSICFFLQFAILVATVRPGRTQRPRAADLRKALTVGIPVGLQMGA